MRKKELLINHFNFRSQHLQLQAVPLNKDCHSAARIAFLDVAESQEIELLDVPEHSSLAQMCPPGAPYFYVEVSKDARLFHRVRKGFPIQFGREVLASPPLLNMEERVDWRECKADKETETQMTKAFRKLFAPFDFTLEDDE